MANRELKQILRCQVPNNGGQRMKFKIKVQNA